MNEKRKQLLAIVELGGYPNFNPLYQRLGYDVETITSSRKAISYLKKNSPDVIVTEFNYQLEFRDRTSNLESILAVTQSKPDTQVIVFYDTDSQKEFDTLKQRFSDFTELAYPIDEQALEGLLK